MSEELKPTRFFFEPEGWEGGFSQSWLYEVVDLSSLQLTDEEDKKLLIHPLTSVFPEALKHGEWKLIVDREIENAYHKKWWEASLKRQSEIGFTWERGHLEDGTPVYYPAYNGNVKKFNV